MTRLVSLLALAALAGLAACTQTPPPSPLSGPQGTQASAAQQGSAAYFRSSVGDRVLFPVDQATLTQEARDILEAQAQWLIQNTGFNATIEGHADEQGTREYNLALGARRAAAVQEYLISRGVAANRLGVVSFGKERPIEVCSTEICYAQNRRAVTQVAPGAGV